MTPNLKLKDYGLLAVVVMGLLYFLFPTTNNFIDSYAYAISAASGEDLFFPHHLLFNLLPYSIATLFNISNTLLLLSYINALFSIGCLLLINSMLFPRVNTTTRAWTLVLLGACFGFMRYATEGEAYIVPLFFSLWASKTILFEKRIFKTALLASIACLFHQIHFFWWLGLLFFVMLAFKQNRIKNFLLFGITSCIVPVVYIFVFYLTENDSSNCIEYVFHDYIVRDNVSFGLKSVAFLLTPISFVRTFFQVHGYMFVLIQQYWALWIIVIFCAACFILNCFKLRAMQKKNNESHYQKLFARIHLIIFALQFLFAFISDGNAEFMVMLPFALVLFFFFLYDFQKLILSYFALSLLIWNVSFALLPSHFLELTSDLPLKKYIESNPEQVYIIKNKVRLSCMLKYEHPEKKYKLYSLDKDATKIDSLLSVHGQIISDITSQDMLSRSSFVSDENLKIFSNYPIQPIDSIPFDLGVLKLINITFVPH